MYNLGSNHFRGGEPPEISSHAEYYGDRARAAETKQ